MKVSVIIPTYNGAKRVEKCLSALYKQEYPGVLQIIVVDDGSSDNTLDILNKYPDIKVISQENQGPAAARNNGASQSEGEIILFTDDDCIPEPNWISEMLKAFENPEIMGVKGAYKTIQQSPVARFVQYEYEEKYRYMDKYKYIDFIDTYSAAYRKNVFQEFGGFNTDFPVACAEDVELSFRIANAGHKLVFNPNAIVTHSHPDTFWWYLQKKYKFAFWRMAAIKLSPNKAKGDTHTPNTMKLQLLLLPFIALFVFTPVSNIALKISTLAVIFYFLTILPSMWHIFKKDLLVGFLSPAYYFGRTCAQFSGVVLGMILAK